MSGGCFSPRPEAAQRFARPARMHFCRRATAGAGAPPPAACRGPHVDVTWILRGSYVDVTWTDVDLTWTDVDTTWTRRGADVDEPLLFPAGKGCPPDRQTRRRAARSLGGSDARATLFFKTLAIGKKVQSLPASAGVPHGTVHLICTLGTQVESFIRFCRFLYHPFTKQR